MKKIRLKKWVKVVLVILSLTLLLNTLKKVDGNFMKKCTEAGYSDTYCKNRRG